MAPETTRFQCTDGVRDVSRISPDNWVQDQASLDRPGNRDIQLATLIVWGKNDKIFPAEGAAPYLRDLPGAELQRDTSRLRTSSTSWRR